MTTKPDYEYYGMQAATWDLQRGDTSLWDDRFFFLDIVRQYGQPVLDIGCGTGRILLDYLAQGIDIDGLDNSPEMLAICRAKAEKMGQSPTLYQQNMEALDLLRNYRTILVPSSSLQLITDTDMARETLRRCYANLQPGGAFITPFDISHKDGDSLDSGWFPAFEVVRPEDGATVRHRARYWVEPDKQLWHSESHYEVELDGKVIATEDQRHSPDGRWYTQAQAMTLYREAGFTNILIFRGFTHESATDDDRFFCVLGVKALNREAM